MNDVVKVGMADLNVVTPPHTIRTAGLGSCVGVVLYDDVKKVAGMAHIMLPDSALGKKQEFNRAKYADTALDLLLSKLEAIGAKRYSLKAKMAGGAQMFSFASNSDMMRIGQRNVEAVKKKLRELSIPILAEDVGGSNGRTIEFNPETKRLSIRTVHQGEKEI
ncbi:chemotaxis protein CheD [Halalkalibacterium halodurans]|jgi:chemotaxis protein CheD|uniref:chemotaxis protein CheD n=1 Tax=Halalkalibacterium halodurans TaxID=86665 RepID=UPI0010FE0B70|nr:chemotaxis protein CheD [Halalkalibacterium halodurans]